MPLYCSTEIFTGLAGASFPATKRQLIDYAKQHDAPEAAVVMLNQLEEASFRDIADVCRNAGIVCSLETANALIDAIFPATKEDLISVAKAFGASDAVIFALEALPDDVPFGDVEDVCSRIA